ncbi:MAG: carbamoyl-phosphate synthase large subunit, partial [Acidobacteria bacterium]|nr:carbamoyl-phosphate synthase large subunit [Acidobacteriota bacterium]
MSGRRRMRVLLLGSGALKIGEAGEFDYSGSQAIKALKEEGAEVWLINPNIATIQTSPGLADRIFLLPVDLRFVTQVIARGRPEGIMLSFGGQTALNCGLALHRRGVLRRYGVRVLGSPISAIEKTEDREMFARELRGIGLKVPRSGAARDLEAALRVARSVGYPVMMRTAFTLGGRGSGIARGEAELGRLAAEAFTTSPQVLIEEDLTGWKEVEYEVVRDRADNCITVCNMENVDPLGVHTGESIVVAPSQTLTDQEYFSLRALAFKVIRHFGIIGECNIQFALDPRSDDYRVIEVNARLSRSSALASKATGYPLARVAAKIALGRLLPEMKNSMNDTTTACFEPALDYLVVKMPKWDLDKFRGASHFIGSEMKSVGEVMAIGRSFEEALQKGCRMLGDSIRGLVGNDFNIRQSLQDLSRPTPRRAFALAQALGEGRSIAGLSRKTGIDPWFLAKMARICAVRDELRARAGRPGAGRRPARGRARRVTLPDDLLRRAKEAGFSDDQIALFTRTTAAGVARRREAAGIVAVVKQIDTLAAEWPVRTNYLYLTYHGIEDDVEAGDGRRKVMILGSGAYRIGSSVEFDWCCVSAAASLRRLGYSPVVVNCNPETVSTDYDMGHTLYFEELTIERVRDIWRKERPLGILLAFGGQIPNNLALACDAAGIPVLGTQPRDIDRAEDRHKFSLLLDRIGQGIEFDYACVHAVQALRELGFETVMINCNPETVSTDYDISDRLYFEPLTFEDVMGVLENEKPWGVIVQFGGQTPLNLTKRLSDAGVRILGTSPKSTDIAEDRKRFGAVLKKLGIAAPPFGVARNRREALAAARRVGYPVLIRPSYVLGGRNMRVCYRPEDVLNIVQRERPDGVIVQFGGQTPLNLT